MNNEIGENIKRLEEVLGEKENCQDIDCRLDKKNVAKIFSPEKGIDEKLVKLLRNEQLLSSNENPNLCDCIVVCRNGKIFVIEILCGKLTFKELQSKKKQVKNCVFIVKHLELEVERAYVVYDRLNINNHDKLRFERYLNSLQRERPPVSVRRLDELKDPNKKNTKAFLICR